MTTVAIISNWDLQCGNAADARDMQRELEKEFTVIGLPGNFQAVKEVLSARKVDVALINWHESRVRVTAEDVRWLKSQGIKVILKLQNTTDQYSFNGDILTESDIVLSHEPVRFDSNKVRAVVIPIGIPEVDCPAPYEEKWIGTAGFPFPWKRFDVVAEAAKKFNVRCRMIAPRSDQMDTDKFMDGIKGHLGPLADIHRGWYDTETVVRMLAECTLNIFWYNSYGHEDQLGQSGSVRMGLAAKRPTIISTHRKLKTLLPYGEELYICLKEEHVYEAIAEIFAAPEKARRPKRLLEDMGWNRVGEQYRKLVRDVCSTDYVTRKERKGEIE